MLKSKKIFILSLILLHFFLLYNCNNQEKEEILEVDFSETETDVNNVSKKVQFSINMAVSAMTSPKETYIYYQQLLNYISRKINTPVSMKQRKTYQEVNNLLETGESNFAFICSGAYIRTKKNSNIELLAVPIVKNEPYYYSYIITHKDSSIKKFDDFYKRTFAFTDLLSNTGRLYPLYLISKLKQNPENYFSKIIYTHAHDFSIHVVARKIVDGASVDSLVFEYIKKNNPDKILDVKIIKISPPFGIPPIVVNRYIDSKTKNKLRKTLFTMHRDEEGKKILKNLMFDKFIEAHDYLYNTVRDMDNFVKKAELKQKYQ